jgi:hypothetical protein
MSDFLARLRVHWHAVAVAFTAALPILLDQLGVLDLKPMLSNFLAPEYVSLIIALMPFMLAFVKPLVHVAPPEDTA